MQYYLDPTGKILDYMDVDRDKMVLFFKTEITAGEIDEVENDIKDKVCGFIMENHPNSVYEEDFSVDFTLFNENGDDFLALDYGEKFDDLEPLICEAKITALDKVGVDKEALASMLHDSFEIAPINI